MEITSMLRMPTYARGIHLATESKLFRVLSLIDTYTRKIGSLLSCVLFTCSHLIIIFQSYMFTELKNLKTCSKSSGRKRKKQNKSRPGWFLLPLANIQNFRRCRVQKEMHTLNSNINKKNKLSKNQSFPPFLWRRRRGGEEGRRRRRELWF